MFSYQIGIGPKGNLVAKWLDMVQKRLLSHDFAENVRVGAPGGTQIWVG